VSAQTADVHTVVLERVETLVLARLSTYAKPQKDVAVAKALYRYAPATLEEPSWRDLVSAALQRLRDHRHVAAKRPLVRADELKRRIGPYAARRWDQWSDRILPGLALGVRADDGKSHARLAHGAWPAAIAARVLQLWTDGLPPTPAALCDALAWRELGLDGAPEPCPAAIRAHFLRAQFLRNNIAADRGPPDRLLRLLAAHTVHAPRSEPEAIRAGLVRRWLTGRELTAARVKAERSLADAGTAAALPAREPVTSSAKTEPSLVDAVIAAAHHARDGVFGDRKVFISSVWGALRATAPWSALELDDFKAQLVAAHRKQQLVLARADLVAAMDPALVAASETRTDGATFHFVVREVGP
jgi:hypothetical protein